MIEYNLLLAIYTIILAYIIYRNRGDSFSPPILFVISMAFYTMPDMLTVAISGIDEYVKDLPFRLSVDSEWAICKFVLVQITLVVAYYKGYNSQKSISLNKRNGFVANSVSLNFLFFIVLVSICLYGTYTFYVQHGGLLAVFASFTNRTELHEGQGILMTIIPTLMTFALAFGMKYCSQKKGNHIFILVFLIIVGFITLTSGGGRSPFVLYMLSLLCFYNLWIKKLSLFSIKFVPVYVGMAIFVIVFQLLRFQETNDLTGVNLMSESDALFDSMAYMKTQLLIQNYFIGHDYWLGRIYSFLLYIFVPRSLFPDKPFIDDGVYIFNMTYNPSDVLATNYFYNSWPPFTCGISYANLGVLGVLIGGYILGIIHAFVYRYVKNNNESFFSAIIYTFVVIKFQLTIFYIANLSYLFIQCFIFKKIYIFFRRKCLQ